MLPPKKPLAKKKYSKPTGDSLAEDIFEFLQAHFNLHLTGEAGVDTEALLIKKSA